MAQVEFKITRDNGSVIHITKEIPEGDLSTFDGIEKLTLQARREIFPDFQSSLLGQAQKEHKKKSIIKK